MSNWGTDEHIYRGSPDSGVSGERVTRNLRVPEAFYISGFIELRREIRPTTFYYVFEEGTLIYCCNTGRTWHEPIEDEL